jgi:hypothetical protein
MHRTTLISADVLPRQLPTTSKQPNISNVAGNLFFAAEGTFCPLRRGHKAAEMRLEALARRRPSPAEH